MAQLYVSNKDESVRMFKSDFVEFFSRVHPAMPLVIYLLLIVASLYFAFAHDGLSILAIVLLFAFGIAIWTLFEYVIHRYAFHYEPSSNIGKQFHFIVHGVHHDVPGKSRR